MEVASWLDLGGKPGLATEIEAALISLNCSKWEEGDHDVDQAGGEKKIVSCPELVGLPQVRAERSVNVGFKRLAAELNGSEVEENRKRLAKRRRKEDRDWKSSTPRLAEDRGKLRGDQESAGRAATLVRRTARSLQMRGRSSVRKSRSKGEVAYSGARGRRRRRRRRKVVGARARRGEAGAVELIASQEAPRIRVQFFASLPRQAVGLLKPI